MKAKMDKRYFVTTAVLLAMLAGMTVWHFSTVKGSAQSPGPFFSADFTCVPDTAHGTTTFLTNSLPAGPFTMTGILTGTQGGSGTLHRVGNKFADGTSVVVDTYDLP